jgi:hypothetical protein
MVLRVQGFRNGWFMLCQVQRTSGIPKTGPIIIFFFVDDIIASGYIATNNMAISD